MRTLQIVIQRAKNMGLRSPGHLFWCARIASPDNGALGFQGFKMPEKALWKNTGFLGGTAGPLKVAPG